MNDPLEEKTKVCLCAIGALILVVRYNIALFQSLEMTTEFYTVTMEEQELDRKSVVRTKLYFVNRAVDKHGKIVGTYHVKLISRLQCIKQIYILTYNQKE